MFELPIGVVVLIGVLPSMIRKQRVPRGKQLTIRAMSWSLVISWYAGGCDWTLHVPVFERARHLFWAVLLKGRDEQVPDLSTEMTRHHPAILSQEREEEQ